MNDEKINKKEIQDFKKLYFFDDIKNKLEVEKFYKNSIKILAENENFILESDSISIFNCLLSIDELYSKLKERDNYYLTSNKTIIKNKISTNDSKIKNFFASLSGYEEELKSLSFKKESLSRRNYTLTNRKIDFKKKSADRRNKIEAEYKKFIKICNNKNLTDLELTKFSLQKNDKEYKNQKLIDGYNLELTKIEDDIFRNEQEIPKISEKITSINEKLTNSKNNIEELKSKQLYLFESLKYNYINISENGKPYSNEVYSVKSFIKDVQNILKDNGLTPLTRIKTNILLGIDNENDDTDLITHLKNNISLSKS